MFAGVFASGVDFLANIQVEIFVDEADFGNRAANGLFFNFDSWRTFSWSIEKRFKASKWGWTSLERLRRLSKLNEFWMSSVEVLCKIIWG